MHTPGATYARRIRYTPDELIRMAAQDQISDAEFAEHQAQHGPFFPERGLTKESLIDYAAHCRAQARALMDDLRVLTRGSSQEKGR